MSGPRAELLGVLESWVEEEREISGVPLQSAAQPRRCTLRERKEAPEPASRLKVRGGQARSPARGVAPSAVCLLSTLPSPSAGPPCCSSRAPPSPCVSTGGGCASSTLLCLLVLCAQDTPDPWQGLDPFDSPDSKPFRKGNAESMAPGHRGWGAGIPGLSGGWGSRACGHGLGPGLWLCSGTACLPPGRPYSVPPRVEEAPGQKRKRKGAVKLQDFHQWYLAACAWGPGPGVAVGLGLAPADPVFLQMPTTLTAGSPGERALPLQVSLGLFEGG